MTTYTPADDAAKTITVIDDGEKAKALVFNRPIKDVADRAEGLKKALEHAASAPLLTSGRGTSDGIKRLRKVDTAAALAALSVGAANDREVAIVESGAVNNGLYMYIHGSGLTADGVFIVTSAAGRWQWVGSSIKGTTPGLAFTNSAGRLTGPSEIANTIVQIVHNSAGQTDIAEGVGAPPTGTTIGANAAAAFADCTADAIYTITNIKTNDELHFTFSFIADCEGASALGPVAIVGLFAGQSGSFTELDRVLVKATFAAGSLIENRRGYTLTGKYIAISNADVVVKLALRVGSTTNTPTAKVFRPCSCTTAVKRP